MLVPTIQQFDLREAAIFETLNDDDLERLNARLVLRRYPRGAPIFFAGDPGTSLCIIRAGRVKLSMTSSDGREVILDLLGRGHVFGEMAILDNAPRSADAVAVEACEVLHFLRNDFLHYLNQRPQVAIRALSVLSRRLRRDAMLLGDAAFLDVPARLARTILRLAEQRPDGTLGTPVLNQETLAGLAGTTRVTLNKWLGFFQDQGMLVREQGAVRILDSEGLRRRAQ